MGLTRWRRLAGPAIAGTRAETAVPPPGSDSIDRVPATRLDALAHPAQAEAETARVPSSSDDTNPTPSSRMSSVTTSPI